MTDTPDLTAIADEIAREFLPDTGPCAFCDKPASHRVADAIVDRVLAMLAQPTKNSSSTKGSPGEIAVSDD